MTLAVEKRDAKALAKLTPKPQVILDCANAVWIEGLEVLHKAGADFNASWRGYRPLHAVMQQDAHRLVRECPAFVDCIRWLLAHGADPELTAAWPPARAILIAAFTGVQSYVALMPRPADIFAFAALGDVAAVRRVLKKDPTASKARDNGGLTALQCAAASRMEPRKKSRECAALLIQAGADIAAKTKSWSHEIDAAYLAANAQHLEMYELLLQQGADATASLPCAVWQSDLRFAEIALAHGANPDDARDDNKPVLNNLIRWGRLKQAEWLLQRGASPNVRDPRGWTALHQAASRGSLRMVQLLLAAGADPDAEDVDRAAPHDVAPKKEVRAVLKR